MDFTRLPDNAFLEIFEYLSLEECMRARRVNKTFRRIAQLMISRTKSLDLTENRFRNLTAAQLAVILDLCSSNLERFKLRLDFPRERYLLLATIFSNYHCPRMTDIHLGNMSIDYPIFEELIRNNPNMESLIWYQDFLGFPAITNNSLKKLYLRITNNAALQSLIGQCPNLKEVDLIIANIDANVLDQFFASIPQVHRVDFWIANNDLTMRNIKFESDLAHLWNLPLTSLTIGLPFGYFLEDGVLHKLAASFPNLRQLDVGLDKSKSTNAGIAALASLQELEILRLKIKDCFGGQYDHGIRQLANCKKLQKLDVYALQVSGGTLVNLFRSCPQLDRVVIGEITQVANPEEAAVILGSLAGIPKRNITIEIRYHDVMTANIWEAEPVKDMIGKLEEIDGLKIRVIRY